MNRPLTFGSLFAGIGGIDLGLEMAGMECVFQVEIDPEARAVLHKHWPNVETFGDIREVERFPSVDVLAGGFPCQDISQANRDGDGIEGEKSGLWSEFYRAIKQVRPSYVIIENVEALRYRGRGLGVVLGDLAAIGYDAEWTVLPASYFGAPHKRARLWLVAYPHCEGEPDSAVNAETPLLSEPRGDVRAWQDPPENLRVDDGVPRELDQSDTDFTRLRQLGNAVVPQVAAWVGSCVVRHYDETAPTWRCPGTLTKPEQRRNDMRTLNEVYLDTVKWVDALQADELAKTSILGNSHIINDRGGKDDQEIRHYATTLWRDATERYIGNNFKFAPEGLRGAIESLDFSDRAEFLDRFAKAVETNDQARLRNAFKLLG